MRTLVIVPLLLLFVIPFPVTHADNGSCWAGSVELGDGTASHTFYVQARDVPGGTGGEFVYEESNGVFTPHPVVDLSNPGIDNWWMRLHTDPYGDLQFGGSSAIVPNDTDSCDYSRYCGCTPDTLIF